jgi:hypothetical protein
VSAKQDAVLAITALAGVLTIFAYFKNNGEGMGDMKKGRIDSDGVRL